MAEDSKSCTMCGRRFSDDALFCPKDGTALVPASAARGKDPYVGREILGHIEITGLIGAGAMGRVYRAYQRGIDRDVAVKILHKDLAQNPDLVARFLREAKVASRLAHPNVVQVLLAGQLEDGTMYLVMEFLDGISLQAALLACGGALSLARALHIALQICDAVGDAHAAGVVHRDLKPENVMLIKRGDDPDYVKVLDFGIARLKASEAATRSIAETAAGLVFGTARYLSPEGARGEPVGPQSDVYALATMVFQMLAGRSPFESDSSVSLLVMQIHDPPPPLRSFPRAAYVPGAIEAAVMRNLAKIPEARDADAHVLGRTLLDAATSSGLSVDDLIARPAVARGRRAGSVPMMLASKERTREHPFGLEASPPPAGAHAMSPAQPETAPAGARLYMPSYSGHPARGDAAHDPPYAPARGGAPYEPPLSVLAGSTVGMSPYDDAAALGVARARHDHRHRQGEGANPDPLDAFGQSTDAEGSDPYDVSGAREVSPTPKGVGPGAAQLTTHAPHDSYASTETGAHEGRESSGGHGWREGFIGRDPPDTSARGGDDFRESEVAGVPHRRGRAAALVLIASLLTVSALAIGAYRLGYLGPKPVVTRHNEVDDLLGRAQAALEARRWDEPPQENVLELTDKAKALAPAETRTYQIRSAAADRVVREALERKARGDAGGALRLFRLAARLSPPDKGLQQEIEAVEADLASDPATVDLVLDGGAADAGQYTAFTVMLEVDGGPPGSASHAPRPNEPTTLVAKLKGERAPSSADAHAHFHVSGPGLEKAALIDAHASGDDASRYVATYAFKVPGTYRVFFFARPDGFPVKSEMELKVATRAPGAARPPPRPVSSTPRPSPSTPGTIILTPDPTPLPFPHFPPTSPSTGSSSTLPTLP